MTSERKDRWETLGGLPLPSIPTETTAVESGHQPDYDCLPGEPPYTRGIHETMYRSRIWTMRQYAGFSTAAETNQRFRMLLEQGQKGLSVAFDLPTQLGMDSDDQMAEGEVGKVGVAIDTIEDMRTLFDGIDLGTISTSMTINAPAAILLALYIAVADERGVPRERLRGTVQNDVLKEYIARGLYVFPPVQSLRLATDVMAWCSEEVPSWNTISISGYHIREAGATAVEEVAFTLANALEYISAAIASGLDIDVIAPRISFFFGCHNDFFEEVAKFRAARTLWHNLLTERHQPKDRKSLLMRFHTQTAGVTLTAQQPLNNIVRVAYQAMAAVLGGTQSLHTNSYDEALGLPTSESATMALRTQQILAEETGVADVVDPLGGSHLVEGLTAMIMSEALALITDMDDNGGAIKCMESGLQQRMIHESAWKQLRAMEDQSRSIIGVNHAIEEEMGEIGEGQSLNPTIYENQVQRLTDIRQNRNQREAQIRLSELREACDKGHSIMPRIIDAVKAECTVGEIMGAMRDSFGTYRAPSGI